jgi:hypothetical protein
MRTKSSRPLQMDVCLGSSQSTPTNGTRLPSFQVVTLPSLTFVLRRPLRMSSSPFHFLAYSGLSQPRSLLPSFFYTLLFRFSTRTELIFNGFALIAAVAAGSAQVSALIFPPSHMSRLMDALGSPS